jgi:antitoxin MazE
METRIQRWGNSLAIRIPKSFAIEVGLNEKGTVNLTVIGQTLVLTPLTPRESTLDELLAGVTPENIHGEVSTGASVGNEAW